MPAHRCQLLLTVRKADLHQQRLQVLLLIQEFPKAFRGARVAAVREGRVFSLDDEPGRVDSVVHGDRAHLVAGELNSLLRLQLDVLDGRLALARDGRKIRPDQVVEEVLFQHGERLFGRGDDQRLALRLAAVIGDGCQVADVIQVRVADDARAELELRLQVHAARQRAGVDGELFVHDEGTGAVARGLPAVAAYDAKFHDSRLYEHCFLHGAN